MAPEQFVKGRPVGASSPITVDQAREIRGRQLGYTGGALARFVRWFSAKHWSRWMAEEFYRENLANIGPATTGSQLMSVLPVNWQAMPNLRAFQTEIQGMTEMIRWNLYDYVALVGGTVVAQINFFQHGAGSGPSVTNVDGQGGQLPGNESFLCTSIQMQYFPDNRDVGATAGQADAFLLLGVGGSSEFKISNKIYHSTSPLFRYPFGAGPATFVGTAPANFINNGAPHLEAVLRIDPPLGILHTRTFNQIVTYSPPVTLTAGGTHTANLESVLDGWMFRAVQ
jgi:hypothetical protein